MANDVAVIELADPITFVPGIIETAELPSTVLRGGDALTMKDGVQVSIFFKEFMIISVICFVIYRSRRENNWLYFALFLSFCNSLRISS